MPTKIIDLLYLFAGAVAVSLGWGLGQYICRIVFK